MWRILTWSFSYSPDLFFINSNLCQISSGSPPGYFVLLISLYALATLGCLASYGANCVFLIVPSHSKCHYSYAVSQLEANIKNTKFVSSSCCDPLSETIQELPVSVGVAKQLNYIVFFQPFLLKSVRGVILQVAGELSIPGTILGSKLWPQSAH